MKWFIPALVLAWCVFFAALWVKYPTRASQPRAVCLQSHREVVLIPTVCGKRNICENPIITDVCDRIEPPPPHPRRQGNRDD